MAFTMNLYYTGEGDNAQKFAHEMIESGTVASNLRYEYFQPLDDPHTVLLIDSWKDQASLDADHDSPMMATIAKLRDKYDLHMRAERYVSQDLPSKDAGFIRK